MTPKTEVTHLPEINQSKTGLSQTAHLDEHLDVSCPRSVRNESGLLPESGEDQVTFRRWKLGFFIFYGAIISLLVGSATIAERQATLISVAAQMNSVTGTVPGSADSVRRPAESRIRK